MRANHLFTVSPARNHPTPIATKPNTANTTSAKPRVTSRKPTVAGSPGGASASPMFAIAVTIPHAHRTERARNARPSTKASPSSQLWAAVASLIRRRKVRYVIGSQAGELGEPRDLHQHEPLAVALDDAPALEVGQDPRDVLPAPAAQARQVGVRHDRGHHGAVGGELVQRWGNEL